MDLNVAEVLVANSSEEEVLKWLDHRIRQITMSLGDIQDPAVACGALSVSIPFIGTVLHELVEKKYPDDKLSNTLKAVL